MSAILSPGAQPGHHLLTHEAGRLVARFADGRLCSLLTLPPDAPAPPILQHDSSDWNTLRAALDRYLSGMPEHFAGIALHWEQGTDFQRQVWRAACEVPWGSTATYGELAARLNLGKGAARAVGHALGANPFHIVVPCHRFVSSTGGLVGYAGGLEWKQALLRIEGILVL